MTQPDTRPVIMHIVNRLDYGGLENGLINLVNNLPGERFRHHILSMTEVKDIAGRIQRPDVQVTALRKRPGKDVKAYGRLFHLIRNVRPTIVHTRNIGTLDCQFIAWLARVPRRVHGEHGWDVDDPDGSNARYRRRRKLFFRLVHRIVPLSRELEQYLLSLDPGLAAKITRICNGVDMARFDSAAAGPHGRPLVFGTITRFREIKAPLDSVRAFATVRLRHECRLLMVGDGPLLAAARALAEELGVADDVEFAGAQLDVMPWLERMDVFVLSSLREGISNTVLEAMAASRPVVASAVGGNLELVVPGETGFLVEPGDTSGLAGEMARYTEASDLVSQHGQAARVRANELYSLPVMVQAYADLYQSEVDAASGPK